MAWLWWNVPFMLVAIVIAIGPLVWAIVLDDRPRRFEEEVLTDIEQLPIAGGAVDGLMAGGRFETVPAQLPGLEAKADTEDGEGDGQHGRWGGSRRRGVTFPPY